MRICEARMGEGTNVFTGVLVILSILTYVQGFQLTSGVRRTNPRTWRNKDFTTSDLATRFRPNKDFLQIKMKVRFDVLQHKEGDNYLDVMFLGYHKRGYILFMLGVWARQNSGTRAPTHLVWKERNRYGNEEWSSKYPIRAREWYDIVFTANLNKQTGLLQIKKSSAYQWEHHTINYPYPSKWDGVYSELNIYRNQKSSMAQVHGRYEYLTFINGPEFARATVPFGYAETSFGKFYCENQNWPEHNTKAVCSSLTSGWQKYIAHKIEDPSVLPQMNYGSLMYEFNPTCLAGNRDIERCRKSTSSICSGSKKPLAVLCLNTGATSIEPIGDVRNRDYLFHLNGLPVCDVDWFDNLGDNDPLEICNENLPNPSEYAALVEYSPTPADTKYVTGLSCSRQTLKTTPDILHSNCEADITSQCSKTYSVKCTNCDKKILKDIVDEITFEGRDADIEAKILEAKRKLFADCMKRDCSASASGKYPDYCKVHDILLKWEADFVRKAKERVAYELPRSESESESESDSESESESTSNIPTIKISTNVAHFDLLKHTLMRQNFKHLSTKLGSMIEDQTLAIADYFMKLAQYDDEIAQADIAYACQTWKKAEEMAKQTQTKLDKDLQTIFKFVKQVTRLETSWNVITFMMNPIQWYSDPKSFDLTALMEDIEGLVDSAIAERDVSSVKSRLNEAKVANNALQNTGDNKAHWEKLSQLFTAARERGELTLDEAKEITTIYNDFSPAVTKQLQAKYQALLTQVRDKLCERILDPDTFIRKLMDFGNPEPKNACKRSEIDMEIMSSNYEEMEDQQFAIMDAFAKAARAMIAKQGAKDIKESLYKTDDDELSTTLRDKKIILAIRDQKQDLIQKACDQMTYMNHGEESPICTELSVNPDKEKEIGELMFTPIGRRNMCKCPKCQSKEGVFLVPAFGRKLDKNSKVNHDIFNTKLMFQEDDMTTQGSMFFKIPDESWLLENKWISANDKGPFFLEQFLVMLPPQSQALTNYQVKMRLVETTVKDRTYTIENGLSIENRVTLNPEEGHCKSNKESLYSRPHNKIRMGKVCVNTPGEVNGIVLPALEKSLWEIQFQSDTEIKELYPAKTEADKTTLFIKVIAKFCSKSSNVEKKNLLSTKREATPPVCPGNEFVDIMSRLESGAEKGKPKCVACPAGSQAMLSNYFCEKCPPEKPTHNADKKYYGCT